MHGELSIPQDKVDDYTYEFVGDDNNDRFTLQLDSNMEASGFCMAVRTVFRKL